MAKEPKEKTKKDKEKRERGFSGTLAAILLFSILTIIGALMLFMPNMKFSYFVYIVSGILIGYGLLLIVKYFYQKGYLHVTDYSFSAGVLIFSLGICTAVRADETAKNAPYFLGIMVLVAGVITLQYAVSLFSVGGGFKAVDLMLSIIMIIVSIVIILNPKNVLNDYETVLYVTVLLIGLIGVLSQSIVALTLRKYHKNEEEKEKQSIFDAEEAIEKTDDKEQIEEKVRENEEKGENESNPEEDAKI